MLNRFSSRAALVALALLSAAPALPAAAQGYDPYNTDERLRAIESQLRDLQDQISQGAGTGTPGGAGPSVQRLNDLEQSVRNLTGQVEQLGFEVRTVKDKLDRFETETTFRLNQLEGTPNATPPTEPSSSDGSASTSPGSTPAPVDAGDGPKPPGSIGEIPDNRGGGTAEGTYNEAMDLLTRAEYDGALKLFRDVVSTYPETDYAAQAQYWIADIYYVQKDYTRAAGAFAEVLKKYPQAGRGPEAMLKLGLSLVNTGKKKEGCTALGAIKTKYPKASDAILGRAEREAKKAGCS
jgi:tol-pal system protein YbgF